MQTLQEQIASTLQRVYIPIGKEKVAITTATVVSFASIPANVKYALVEVEGTATTDYLRYWQSGEAPSSTDGIKRPDGSAFDLIGPVAIRKFRGIGVGGTVTLQIQYFG